MTEQERHAVSQEERKEKIRARYRGVDRNELEFIPAKQKEKLFEDTGTKRVCAYCRVSTDDVNQTSSYELQKNHYEDMEQMVKPGDVITMSAGCRHTVIADTELKLIEVQLGADINVHDKQKFELEQ